MKHDFIDRYSRLESPVHALDARTKFITLLALMVICATTPPSNWRAFAVYACVSLIIAAASRVPPLYLLTRTLIVLPFILIVAVFTPFMKGSEIVLRLGVVNVYKEGLLTLWGVTSKSMISVFALILLSSTTPFPDLMRGLERLKFPKFITTVSSFMYRYLFIIIDEAERLKRARDSRNFRGRWIWQSKTIGQMVASLFLRSHERAERVYLAMCSRGFDGTFPRFEEKRIGARDFAFVALVVMSALAGRLAPLWS